MPGPPVSVTARAVSPTGTMPVRVELAGDVLFFVIVFHLVVLGVLGGFSRGCTWIAGPLGRTAGSSLTIGRISIAVARPDRPGSAPSRPGSAPSEAAGGDVAVGGGGADVEFGGAIVLEGVTDAAAAGAGVQGGRDAGGGADRDVARLCAEHDRAAHGLGNPDVAPCGADLRGAIEPADLDVAVDRSE